MAHDVVFRSPECKLGVADVVFNVKMGKKVGTLKVSKGSVAWYLPNAKKGKRLSWSEFSELMENSPKGVMEPLKKTL